MEKHKYDIFISYSRNDESKVMNIVNKLTALGYKIWIDEKGIKSGDPSFKKTIVEAIESSKVIMFFSSFNSNQSNWTEKEIGIAINKKKYIIPIKLDKSQYAKSIEFDLINCDYIDYSIDSKKNNENKKLYSCLESIFGKKDDIEHHININKELLLLAEKYREGIGVPRDYKFAATLYDKAASQGNPVALCNLATLYLKGWGIEQDLALAATLYKMAAEKGSALATFKLGQMYFKGIYVGQNYNKAILLYQQASSMGCKLADKELENL